MHHRAKMMMKMVVIGGLRLVAVLTGSSLGERPSGNITMPWLSKNFRKIKKLTKLVKRSVQKIAERMMKSFHPS